MNPLQTSLDTAAFVPTEGVFTNFGHYQNYRYPNVVTGRMGLRDRLEMGTGLQQFDPAQVSVVTNDYNLTVDTRDCIGTGSLADAQLYATENGVRNAAAGLITGATGPGISPITLTATNITDLKNGDIISIRGVIGNTNANGPEVQVASINYTAGTFNILGTGNGPFLGTGEWYRAPDPGFPVLTDKDSVITGNTIIVNLQRPLKNIKTLALYNINIPRDIIPLTSYISDFVSVSSTFTDVNYIGITVTDWTTYIPQEADYMITQILSFYTTPLALFRSYIDGEASMPNPSTPTPLTLWNPPKGDWPLQPIPYPFQTVPTYRSAPFAIGDQTGYYLVLSGYGVYDLADWTINTGNPISDSLATSIMRKLLLILICQNQSYANVDYVTLILNSQTVSNTVSPFGYGSYQRFVPGPACGTNYQPATVTAGDPTVSSTDSPVPFPYFRGNVLGPYNYPGARFQRNGAIDTLQDLFLNGDLANLFGNPIIDPTVPAEDLANHPTFGLNFVALVDVNLGNISNSTNHNILNAMRIVPNGFGAATVRAAGQGNPYYTNAYSGTSGAAGGQGPSTLNPPSSWVNYGLQTPSGSLNDPIAQGPSASGVTAESADGSYNAEGIHHGTSYYDLGPGQGQFVGQMLKYINFATNEIPDSDLIVKIQEADRNIFSQSTNQNNSSSILDCPVRLNIGSTNGTQQYQESIATLLGQCQYYWTNNYAIPEGSWKKLHISLYTYEGAPIPIETLLQQRKSVELSKITSKILNFFSLATNPFNLTFLFDPKNPVLLGRLKRYIQMMFKVSCYDRTAPGMISESMAGIPPYSTINADVAPYG